MKLSILDQVVMSEGRSAQNAVQETVQLATLAEEWGYTRYWIAEHHDLPGLVCPAPEVLIGLIGAQTSNIRVGAGAVLLPNYQPYHVAETYNLLASMYPSRIDLGLSRSPGGSAEASQALSSNMLQAIYSMPQKLEELLHFIHQDFPRDHTYSSLQAAPVPTIPPVPWILGTSIKSAQLAAKHGLPYAVGHFMNADSSKEAATIYKKQFQATRTLEEPQLVVAASVICAETLEQAEQMARSAQVWSIQREKGELTNGLPSKQTTINYQLTSEEEDKLKDLAKRQLIGTPQTVKKQLQDVAAEFQTDECMVLTNVHSHQDRVASYRLLAEVFSHD
ncbi:LLM class flavin-dependent oxidoreductase [Alkalicoccobacillus porphyridii]|uniref:LLM class flavin-dependent oxidoreductase n=1 Tax=Alkalicoccobacillus porphyridii TaxID=2597270 RepID=A0A554A046_9BACI|nr:LLM class flavin-dependent oxidoreductase [Alkalicoccobacillus porphyridii]TSB47068.1 LLM class flavin-dependent oxidoreductase [Alkalicoccobacillus porphyridii]